MKILQISNDYYNSGVYCTLHQGFLRDGLKSVFFVPLPEGVPAEPEESVIAAYCFRKNDRYWYLNKQRKVYRALRPVLETQKPDLLHGYFLFSAGISCLWAKQEYGIPYVVTVQNTDVNTIYRYFIHLRGLGQKVLAEAAAVIFPSPAYRDYVLMHMVSRREQAGLAGKSHVLPFAVAPFWTAHPETGMRSIHEDALRLLTVGRVDRDKNQTTVLRAAELLTAQGLSVELSVVGETADENVQRMLEHSPIVRRVFQLPKEQLIDEYRRADIFVLPSKHESFGLVYAEALSQGLPVLYTAGQGFDGQFPEGHVGYHVDAGCCESVAEVIQTTLKEYPALQGRCSMAARRFSQAQVCAEAERIYSGALHAGMS